MEHKEMDILVEMSFDKVIELGNIYKPHQETAPHIFSFIQTALRWKKQLATTSNRKYFNFYMPKSEENLKENGTFIAIGHFPWKIIVLYTLDTGKSGSQHLFNALVKTKLFNYSKHVIVFYAIDEKHIQIVESAMKVLNLQKVKHEDTNIWRMRPNNAPYFSDINILRNLIDENVDLRLRRLTPVDAWTINKHWPHREAGSEQYVKLLIAMNGGYGIETKREGKLIAWIVKTPLGQIGLLHVLPMYRQQGLALTLLRALTRDIAADGFHILGVILAENHASQKLFSKAGFDKLLYCTCMTYQPIN